MDMTKPLAMEAAQPASSRPLAAVDCATWCVRRPGAEAPLRRSSRQCSSCMAWYGHVTFLHLCPRLQAMLVPVRRALRLEAEALLAAEEQLGTLEQQVRSGIPQGLRVSGMQQCRSGRQPPA
jgi:hypothetical protein